MSREPAENYSFELHLMWNASKDITDRWILKLLVVCKAWSKDNESENMKGVESDCSTISRAWSIAFASAEKMWGLFRSRRFSNLVPYTAPAQNRIAISTLIQVYIKAWKKGSVPWSRIDPKCVLVCFSSEVRSKRNFAVPIVHGVMSGILYFTMPSKSTLTLVM